MNKIQLEDFIGYRYLSSVQYNPDGTLAAYVLARADMDKNGYVHDLYLYNPASGEKRCLTQKHDTKTFIWYNNQEMIYPRVNKPDTAGNPEISTDFVIIDTDGKERVLFNVPMAADIAGRLSDDLFVLTSVVNLKREQALEGKEGEERKKILEQLKYDDENCSVFEEYPFWFNAQGVISGTRKTIFLYDLKNQALTRVTEPRFRCKGLCVDEATGWIVFDGQFLDKVEVYKTGIYVYDSKTGKTKQILPQEVYRLENLGVLCGKVVFSGSDLLEWDVSQCPDLYTIDVETCTCNMLFSGELSVGNPVGSDCRLGGGNIFKVHGDRVYFISGIADASHLYYCDASGHLGAVLEKDGSIDAFDVHGERFLAIAMHDMRLQELYEGSISTGATERISNHNDEFFLNTPPVVPERLWFENKSGVEIHGFVLKPHGYDPSKKYPMILDIHGGPHLSYGEVFYHEMQYWAHKGYFVLFSNPRGGDGRGNEFGHLSGKFGTIDYDDLMEFCDKALDAYPAIDKDRMGVTGGSYGGFMTNWIIGQTGRFAAAAAQRSISNFVSMEGTSDIGKLFATGQVLATTHTDFEKIWRHSPLKYADNCKTPTLFIHSEEDYRCWMVEALQMYTTLINNGVPTKLCLFHGENHELSRSGKPKNRIRRLQEITNWMDQYLNP